MIQKQSVSLFLCKKSRFSRRSAGFTLIEILVVVSIIVLLVGIGAVGGSKFIQEARKEQTRAALKGLTGANDAYKAALKLGNINHKGTYPINWPANGGNGRSSSERFVFACKQVNSAEQAMINAIKSGSESDFSRLYRDADGDGVEEIYDRWGTEIEFRTFNAGTRATGTGPQRVDGSTVDNNLLPDSTSPFFVAAGPDEQFGTEDDITSLQN